MSDAVWRAGGPDRPRSGVTVLVCVEVDTGRRRVLGSGRRGCDADSQDGGERGGRRKCVDAHAFAFQRSPLTRSLDLEIFFVNDVAI